MHVATTIFYPQRKIFAKCHDEKTSTITQLCKANGSKDTFWCCAVCIAMFSDVWILHTRAWSAFIEQSSLNDTCIYMHWRVHVIDLGDWPLLIIIIIGY